MYRALAIILCLAASILAYEPGNYLEFQDALDSAIFTELPDSLKTTLQEKLQNDTGLVFWGHIQSGKILASIGEDIYQSDDLSPEDRAAFSAWVGQNQNIVNGNSDSIPKDLQEKIPYVQMSSNYELLKIDYIVKKIYNRETHSWVAPAENQKTLTRKHFIKNQSFIQANPPKLLRNVSLISSDHFDRVYFKDGFSKTISPTQLYHLDTLAGKPGTYLPNSYVVELHKDMSAIYKEYIKNALTAGDREAIKYYMATLDSFLIMADGKYFVQEPTPIDCNIKRLMSVYLGTFEDKLNCPVKNKFLNEDESIIHLMLVDSIKVMHNTGTFTSALSDRSSGDKAFWEALTGAMFIKNQKELNALVKKHSENIKKPDQKEFLYRNFYKEITTKNLTAEILFGGGMQAAAGDAANYFKVKPSFDVSLEFFYKNYGGGYVGRTFVSKKDDEGNYFSAFLIDLYFGYLTFKFPHIENRVFIGPTLTFTDLINDDAKDGPTDSDFSCGIHVATAFDFYPTAPNIKKITTTGLRLGLRLQAGVSTYSTDLVKDGNGVSFHIGASLLMQAYETRLKEYGE